ncbi:MAG TPA: AMP-binding protein [Candidatus Dormibacteraeota bacterium]
MDSEEPGGRGRQRSLPGAGAISWLLRPDRPVRAAAAQLDAVRVLTEAGVLRPSRPDRLVAALLSLVRWGFTPAAGYATAAARYPDEPAIVDDNGTVTFAELDRRTSAIAHGLHEAGVGEGDRVAVLCRNHRGFVEAIVAISKLGADGVLLNTGFAGPQLAGVIRGERARVVIHDQEFTELLREGARRRRRFIAWHDTEPPRSTPTLDRLAERHRGETVAPPSRPGRFTLLTSGTTGAPRGASRGAAGGIDPAIAILSRIPLRARQTTVIAAPLFHTWGFANLLLGTLLASTVVLQRRFDPAATLAALAQHRAHALVAVPVMLQRILDLPDHLRASRRPASLRVVAVSGSALPGPLALRFMDEFGDVLHNLYGSTEVAWAAIATPTELRSHPGTAGRPPRGTIVRILDEHGHELPPEHVGRIFVGNSMVFEGYTSGADKERLGSLVSTGDVGRFTEDGLLLVEGRDDDMIISGGENVFPAEVEETLLAHPAVADCAVVGVPDDQFGQRLAAYVVRRDGTPLDAATVRSHVRDHLARHKVPRDVTFVDSLPRNATGKVVRRELG